jgi:hypothetical protein
MSLADRIQGRVERRRLRALNQAVRQLSVEARQAMLDALQSDELIFGAYTDRSGRTCPMLAAHRRGAKVHVGDFPRAWDAFGGARRPRPATPRELEILGAMLEESVNTSRRRAAPHSPAPAAPDPASVKA